MALVGCTWVEAGCQADRSCFCPCPCPCTRPALPADGGGQGNVIGAVAEAGFMLGLERNSDAVLAGAGVGGTSSRA